MLQKFRNDRSVLDRSEDEGFFKFLLSLAQLTFLHSCNRYRGGKGSNVVIPAANPV